MTKRTLRDRVVRHTQRLLKTGAIAGTAVLASCSDTGPIAARRTDAGDDAGVDAGAADSGTDAGATDAGFDAGYDAGYIVVDPMPPPANCNDDPRLSVNASAALQASGEVRVVLSDWMFASWQLTNQVHSFVAAQLVGQVELAGYSLALTLQPDVGATTISFQVDLTCDDGLDHLPSASFIDVSIALPAADAGTGPLVVTVTPADRDH